MSEDVNPECRCKEIPADEWIVSFSDSELEYLHPLLTAAVQQQTDRVTERGLQFENPGEIKDYSKRLVALLTLERKIRDLG